MPTIVIRPMLPGDLDFAAACTAAEGWATETRAELEGFLACAPGGSFVAELSGERIGIGVTTTYGDAGFIGELIVAREHRGRGIGRGLLDHAIAHLRGQGVRSIFLDGVSAAVRLYERAGFLRVCRSLRFTGEFPRASSRDVRPMRPQDLDRVLTLDRSAFAADRSAFLRRRLALYPELCRVQEMPGELTGFVMGRRGSGVVALGPWVIRDEGAHSPALLGDGSLAGRGTRLIIGTLETSQHAVAGLRVLGLGEHPDPPWRMRLGDPHPLGLSTKCCAIGSAAKG